MRTESSSSTSSVGRGALVCAGGLALVVLFFVACSPPPEEPPPTPVVQVVEKDKPLLNLELTPPEDDPNEGPKLTIAVQRKQKVLFTNTSDQDLKLTYAPPGLFSDQASPIEVPPGSEVEATVTTAFEDGQVCALIAEDPDHGTAEMIIRGGPEQ